MVIVSVSCIRLSTAMSQEESPVVIIVSEESAPGVKTVTSKERNFDNDVSMNFGLFLPKESVELCKCYMSVNSITLVKQR